MSSRSLHLLLVVILAIQTNAFFNGIEYTATRRAFAQTNLHFSPPVDATTSADILTVAIEKLPVPDASLNVLLENMPVAEKYSLLLQSYASNIIDNSNRTIAALDIMDSLFTEMLSKSIAPSEKSSKLLIDASSTFCSSIKLGKSLQLVKAGK